jgi:hypothetical protein
MISSLVHQLIARRPGLESHAPSLFLPFLSAQQRAAVVPYSMYSVQSAKDRFPNLYFARSERFELGRRKREPLEKQRDDLGSKLRRVARR